MLRAVERVNVPDRVLGAKGASPRLRRDARAIAEALFSTQSGPPPAARLEFVVGELDDFLRQAGPRARLVMRLAFLAVRLVAPLVTRTFRPLDSLSLTRRIAVLERLERSRLGIPFFAVKGLLCILYYEHPDAARSLGYDPADRLVQIGSGKIGSGKEAKLRAEDAGAATAGREIAAPGRGVDARRGEQPELTASGGGRSGP